MTRGIRNHNPLNIRRNGTKWRGQASPQTDPHFVQFQSMSWGIRAACCLLRTYAQKYQLHTIEGIVARWAPPTENHTEAYIHHVSQLTGIDPAQPLGEDQWPLLLQAMARIETGETLPMEVIRKGVALFKENP